MESSRIQELINRYNSGNATDQEVREIEALLESGKIELNELTAVDKLQHVIDSMKFPSPSENLDDRFYQMLALEKRSKDSFSWGKFFSWPELAPRLALASITLILGIGIGYFTRPAASVGGSEQISEMNKQLVDLKEMMMLNLLEKESATERLKAVSLTSEMNSASAKVTSALVETLNNDENVNVRLAALEALKPYSRNSHVREALIRSIAKQDSPLVQVALAEAMAELQVKSSVKELEKIVNSDKTPKDVKNRIKQSIDILI